MLSLDIIILLLLDRITYTKSRYDLYDIALEYYFCDYTKNFIYNHILGDINQILDIFIFW